MKAADIATTIARVGRWRVRERASPMTVFGPEALCALAVVLPVNADMIVRALAGYHAEREFGFRPHSDRWQSDRAMASDMALRLGGDGAEASLWLRIAHGRAAGIAHNWRESIEALAIALEQNRLIDAAEAKEIAIKARGRCLREAHSVSGVAGARRA